MVTDIVDPATRSRMMSSIRGKDTKPEMIVRRFLHGKGFRYRLHVKELPGKPDIVLPRFSAVVLVHGCFWHHHAGCKFARMPKTNSDFWKNKIMSNVKRDKLNVARLESLGWRIIIIWECEINDGLDHVAKEITNQH